MSEGARVAAPATPPGRPSLERAARVLRDCVVGAQAIRRVLTAADRRDVVLLGTGPLRNAQRALERIAAELGEDLEKFRDAHASGELEQLRGRRVDPRPPLPTLPGACPTCGGSTRDPASDADYSAPCEACGGTGVERNRAILPEDRFELTRQGRAELALAEAEALHDVRPFPRPASRAP